MFGKRSKLVLLLVLVLVLTGIGARTSGPTFLELLDTPSSYSGEAGSFLVVDQDEDSVVFTDTIKMSSMGEVIVDTSTGGAPFWITRLGATNQGAKFYVDDAALVVESIQDEQTGYFGSMLFRLGTQEGQSPNFGISDYRSGSDVRRLHIDMETGDVGLGTAAPRKRLEVVGDVRVSSTSGGQVYMDIDEDSITSGLNQGLTINALPNNNAEGIDFQINGTNAFWIDWDRNVGSGTTDPTAKFDVNGDLHTEDQVYGGRIDDAYGAGNIWLGTDNAHGGRMFFADDDVVSQSIFDEEGLPGPYYAIHCEALTYHKTWEDYQFNEFTLGPGERGTLYDTSDPRAYLYLSFAENWDNPEPPYLYIWQIGSYHFRVAMDCFWIGD